MVTYPILKLTLDDLVEIVTPGIDDRFTVVNYSWMYITLCLHSGMNNSLWDVPDCYTTGKQYYNKTQYINEDTGLQFYSSGAWYNTKSPPGTPLKLKTHEIGFIQIILFSCQIVLECCMEHGSITATLHATFQNDLIIKQYDTNKRDFARFGFKMSFGRVSYIALGLFCYLVASSPPALGQDQRGFAMAMLSLNAICATQFQTINNENNAIGGFNAV